MSDVQSYFSSNASDYAEFFDTSSAPRVYPFGRIRTERAIGYIDETVGLGGSRLLDQGCGTGRLCILAAKLGMIVTGIDFAEGMLAEAHKAADALPADIAGRLSFRQGSVLATGLKDQSFDAITALGLIEYLDAEGIETFFTESASLLRTGGVLVIETRNRLFNMGSLNSYTKDEISGGTAAELLSQIIASEDLATPDRIQRFAAKIGQIGTQLSAALDADLQDIAAGHATDAGTGVENPLRRLQHTPDEMRQLGKSAGLRLTRVIGLHPHPLPPALERKYPRFYNCLTLAFEELAETNITLPKCSSILCCFERE